jgi:hypothetical protein
MFNKIYRVFVRAVGGLVGVLASGCVQLRQSERKTEKEIKVNYSFVALKMNRKRET